MKLRYLLHLCLAGTLVGLLMLGGFALHTWTNVSEHLQAVENLDELRQESTRLATAIDYATLLREDASGFGMIAVSAAELADRLRNLDEGLARLAVRHLDEISHMAERVIERGSTSPLMPVDLRENASQMRTHLYGLLDAFDGLQTQRFNSIYQEMLLALSAFVVVALLLSAVSYIAFAIILRRVGGPMLAIEKGLRSVASGQRESHIDLQGNDELSDLARAFNSMVADLQRQEQALLESERRFRLVANVTMDVVWDWDLREHNRWWSEGTMSRFGYTTGESAVELGTWTDYIHPVDRERVLGDLQKALNGSGGEWSDEYRFRRADGSYAVIVDRAYIERNDQGQATRLIGSMSDVTEQRQLQSDLVQAQRLEAVGQLTGGVAHDFNNLLQVILGSAELLRERLSEKDDCLQTVEMIRTSAERGADLTGRLLTFSRKQALDERIIDVNALIEGMRALLQRAIGEHVEITVRSDPALKPALVDSAQLENALLNLCINARDAMPSGGLLAIETENITLEDRHPGTESEIPNGPYVVISVSDTGSGMSREVLSRVFEPFYTTKEKGKGSGLGLSMVYGFARQSRGTVRLISELGQGTTVKLFLPQADMSGDTPVAGSDIQEQETGGTETILVVEDNGLVLEHVVSLLQRLGYDVLSASNGREALALLRQRNDINLLFTDVIMPGGLNGRQLADEARRMRPGLPILFTSGHTGNVLDQHGRLAPDVHLLSKPYRKRDLALKLRALLDRYTLSSADRSDGSRD